MTRMMIYSTTSWLNPKFVMMRQKELAYVKGCFHAHAGGVGVGKAVHLGMLLYSLLAREPVTWNDVPLMGPYKRKEH
jgi:hypothetical protein